MPETREQQVLQVAGRAVASPNPRKASAASGCGKRYASSMPARSLAYNATLTRRDDFTPELSTFHVRYDEPPEAEPVFVPGQYVALGLNNERRPDLGSVRRSMSIASAPERTDAFEFYVRFVRHPASENPFTHLLWPLEQGARIHMTRKPAGKFTVSATAGEDDGRVRLFVAAGTGLAPFLSIVRSAKSKDPKADMSRWCLIHGVSYPSDLCYAQELQGYAEQNGLRYLPTVSRPREAPGWTGDTGRAEDYFLPERLEDLEARVGLRRGALTPRTAAVLVCGLQGTIACCIERLARRGFVPFHRRLRNLLGVRDEVAPSLWWEQYDAEPVIDVHDAEAVAALRRDLERALARLG
jgi:ferredoxin--NADP+ reductase